ncbi:transposase [Leptolyngbya boryana NIES-2135]|jgi:transposase|uniref:Transposase n=1 Tax=Leptolyngbya boryana NIES-2135 TaxID=1973484 RepID=A0A1Z4JF81_LEPBY|nr:MULTISPECIES: helix-turn-helix domain-containing protein [unclassified Leptolyngbya]BAS58451.1 transposase [Leptolyngbya boryana IAM M-101]BAS64799.1 transposase [Leptolyngbya boryana dg5]BAY55338.1 transposase [Leptolyngbya boryana NIES-2135]MBD2368507.1 helix-turn-helix domain-containing protein [Leptolyngbya sp. FACHB-161]MBD2374837.1 helix-turn-helix domain-containing protein [Leptolyngbya sp. FACHB-238]
MPKRQIRLTDEQRQRLVEITSKGKVAVRTFKRSQILLLSEQGYKDQIIAERVGVSVATVERTRQKFVQQGLDQAITEKPRPGKPCKLDGKTEAFLIATACSDAPDGRANWTMQLLADRLVALNKVESISDETVRRILKKTNLSRG